jgi:hypothetical protein
VAKKWKYGPDFAQCFEPFHTAKIGARLGKIGARFCQQKKIERIFMGSDLFQL